MPGDILGHRGYGEDLKYPISASALEDSQLCFISNRDFLDALKDNALLGYHLTMFFATELKHAEKRFFNFTTMTVKERLAYILYELATSHGIKKGNHVVIDLYLSRKILMNFVATTYESTVRVISEFAKNKILTFQGHSVTVLSMKKLRAISKQN